MATLWDKLTKKKAPEVIVENTIYNPLGVRVGESVKINTVDLDKKNFVFKSPREVKRLIDGQKFIFADYDVQELSSKEILRIRLNPIENPDSQLTHDVVLLSPVGEGCGFDKNFYDGLLVNETFTEGEAVYWRVNDVTQPWKAVTITLQDLDHSGKIDKNEAISGELTYWDFWRETADEADNKVIEFYFVEMDGDGNFTFWVGKQIDPLRIVI